MEENNVHLTEAANNSRIFTNNAGTVSVGIVRETGIFGSINAQFLLNVTSNTLGVSDRLVDVGEVGNGTLVFDSAYILKVFGTIATPGYHDYTDAWFNGPWEVTSVSLDGANRPSPYFPILVRIRGPKALLLEPGFVIEIFGADFPLTEFDGQIYAGVSANCGNPPAVIIDAAKLKEDEPFGALIFREKEGFVLATLKDSAVNKKLVDNTEPGMIFDTVKKIYEKFRDIARERKPLRLGGNPRATYKPTYETGGANDPLKRFANLIIGFQNEARQELINGGNQNPSNAQIRERAAALMSKPGQERFVLPNVPSAIFTKAKDARIYSIGSKYLLGHWEPEDEKGGNIIADPEARSQNVSQIGHFNVGFGFSIVKPDLDRFIAAIERTYPGGAEGEIQRARAIMSALEGLGFKEALKREERDNLAKFEKATAALGSADVAVYVYNYFVQKNDKYLVLAKTAELARRYAGQGEIDPFTFDVDSNRGEAEMIPMRLASILTGALIICAVFVLTGCSAPRSPKYQKYQQVAQEKRLQVAKAKSRLPIKRADYYASHPEGSEADYHFKLGEGYLSRGQQREAFREFEKTIQLNLYHQEALLYLAYFVSKTDDSDSLNTLVRRIRQRDPDNAAIHDILALRSLQRGDLNKAEKELKTSLQHNPHSVIPHVGLSAVYQRRGDYGRAAAELQALLAQKPDNRVVLLELADCYWRTRQRDKAMELYDRCLKLSPQSPGLHLSLARIYRQARLFDRALSLYQEAQRLAPRDVSIRIETAQTHLLKGDADAALTCLDEVKKQSKGAVAPKVRQLASVAYLKKGDPTRAEAELKEGLKQTPHQTSLRLQLASLYLRQQKYDDAIEQYQQILKGSPESFAVQFRLGQTYELAGDRDQAIDAYQRALRLQPHSPKALNNLAYLYAQSGTNLNEALQLAQQADKRTPNRPEVLDTLGFVHYTRKEYDEALKYLTRAKELSGERPSATMLYHLALVYHHKGMKQAAIAELTEALKGNPSPEQAQEMRRLLEEWTGE